MDNCHCQAADGQVALIFSDKHSYKPFLKQLLVSSSVWTSFFMMGLAVGAPTVMVPQIRKQNATLIDDEMASWLSCVFNYAAIPWVFIIPIMAAQLGRKIPFIFMSVTTFAAFSLMYHSEGISEILVSEVILGFLLASQITISLLIISEYTSPKYRGIFLTIKSATFYWGIWVANALGTFCPWQTIGICGVVCSVYALATTALWPESPYWLASTGKFEECKHSHRWLNGTTPDSEEELKSLIDSQRIATYDTTFKFKLSKECFHDIFELLTSKGFYKPVVLSWAMLGLYHSSGKMVISVYAIDIIKKITNSESTAYSGMLILDGVCVLGMYTGCGLSRILKRRTLLLVSSIVGVIFLFIISLYLFLVRVSYFDENKYISIFLLTMFSLTICCGPMILSTSIYGELIPLKGRGMATIVVGLVSNILMGTVLKIAPLFFRYFTVPGSFLVFAVSASIFIYLLYKYLPETKDKTIQEIADVLTGPKFSQQSKEMVNLYGK